jgi:hypothetical protein
MQTLHFILYTAVTHYSAMQSSTATCTLPISLQVLLRQGTKDKVTKKYLVAQNQAAADSEVADPPPSPALQPARNS